ncbi:MAG: hypothetical protein J6A29_03480 [Clostridia bacterium]|nr:hypothetical protein [Clostridia bacterium]
MSMFSLLISLFAVIFWVLRVAVAFTASMGMEFMLKPLNLPVEIILTFITFVCIIFIFKRSLLGALVYLISNLGYYGVYLYNIIVKTEEIVVVDYLNIIISIIGILLPLIIFIDVGMSQSNKKTTSKTKKTDWFFQNEQFDRKYDDRADRNQYKF